MSYDILSATDGSKYLSKGDALPGLNKKARYNSESDFMYNRGFNASAMYKHTFSEAFKLMENCLIPMMTLTTSVPNHWTTSQATVPSMIIIT